QSANKAKARQATSPLRHIDRIKTEAIEVKPLSRQNPYIRFEQKKVWHTLALTAELISKSYDQPVIRDFSTTIEAGQKVAIIGANGVGKTTLLRMLAADLKPDSGRIKWADNADMGYMAQDVSDDFDSNRDLLDWISDYRQPDDDDQAVRGILGRLLFSSDD